MLACSLFLCNKTKTCFDPSSKRVKKSFVTTYACRQTYLLYIFLVGSNDLFLHDLVFVIGHSLFFVSRIECSFGDFDVSLFFFIA